MRIPISSNRSWLGGIVLAAAALLAAAPAQSAVVYSVSYDGAKIDLNGSITVNSLGSFSASAFDANVLSYSITASNNGLATYVFTDVNSTWGPTGTGDYVTITALADTLSIVANSDGPNGSDYLFLIADVVTNGARENLRLFEDQFGFRMPAPSSILVFDTVNTPFVIGNSRNDVPEPSTLALIGLALAGVAASSRQRKAA